MKILLFGKNGQVGWELNRSLLTLGEVVALGRDDADLSKHENLRAVVRENRPDVIVNAAAYTNVDKAEEEECLAEQINGLAPGVLAEEAREINALLVHYSTDYVFDGAKLEPYTENDEPRPINAYGRSKLIGEDAIHAAGCQYVILRISWVYSARGRNFLRTMLSLMKEKDKLSVVDDQYGAPTWARQIADVTSHIIMHSRDDIKRKSFCSGLYHLASFGSTSWHGFAEKIIHYASMNKLLDGPSCKLISISSAHYASQAKRPINSCLDTSMLEKKYALTMPAWDGVLELCMQDMKR